MILRRVVISVAIVVGLGIGAWLFLSWANSPARQRVSVGEIPTSMDTTPKDIATDFFATKVPAGYRVQTSTNPSDSDMVQLTAFDTSGNETQIGITTALLSSEQLSGVADYLYRVKRTDIYETVATIGFASDNPTFRKKDGTEVTTFIVHDQRYASIAISGQAANSATFTKIRTLIAENWRWL